MKYTSINETEYEYESNNCKRNKLCNSLIVVGLILLVTGGLKYLIVNRLQIIRNNQKNKDTQDINSISIPLLVNQAGIIQSNSNITTNSKEQINQNKHQTTYSNQNPNQSKSTNILSKNGLVFREKKTIQKANQLQEIGEKQIETITKRKKSIDRQIFNDVVNEGKNQRSGIPSKRAQLWKQFILLKQLPLSSDLAQQQKQYFQDKYNISHYLQLPFCVVVPTFQNAAQKRYLNNINSILQQNYQNYHVVIIDDASRDGTGKLLQHFVQQYKISSDKVRIIINKERKMAMPNIYRAAKQFCKSYELFVIVDGDDQLVGKQVFKFFNSIFQSKDVWIAYSNFITTRGSIGFSRPYHDYIIKNNGYRKGAFTTSHLRVFYTKLLTLVQEGDLKNDQGQWFRAANDVAMYIPIMQMSHTRIIYLPQICYLYNSNTGLNNHKNKYKQQRNNQKLVRQKKAYKGLQKLFEQEEVLKKNEQIDKKIKIRNQSMVKKFDWQD